MRRDPVDLPRRLCEADAARVPVPRPRRARPRERRRRERRRHFLRGCRRDVGPHPLRRDAGPRRRGARHPRRRGGPGAGRQEPGGVLRPPPLVGRGRHADGQGRRPSRHLHRPRADVVAALCPGVVVPRGPRLGRGRDEVLPDGGLLFGDPPLRHRHALRADGDDAPSAARRLCLHDARRRLRPSRRNRPSRDPGGARLQDVARPVPRLGARRLSGNDDARRHVPLDGPEGRRGRRPDPGPPRDLPGRARRAVAAR